MCLFSLNIFSQENSRPGFYYTGGPAINTELTNTGDIGNFPSCYIGEAKESIKYLQSMLKNDFLKSDSQTSLFENTNVIKLSYVDINCLEDNLKATKEDCTIIIYIPYCE